MATIEGEVPLAETFGYSTDLRSMTQGQGTFTMEFAKYRRVPASIQEEIVAEKKKQLVGEIMLAHGAQADGPAGFTMTPQARGNLPRAFLFFS